MGYLIDSHPIPHHLIIIQRITHSIFLMLSSHSLCVIFRGSTQLRGSSQPGSIILPHPLSRILRPEPLFSPNSLWMTREVRQSADDGLSAFQLCRLTTPLGVIHVARRVHSDSAMMLGYVHY